MPLTNADILYPTGRVHSDLLPDRSSAELAADIDIWLAEAYADTRVSALDVADQDAPARAWVYHRAFDAACVAMASNPSTAAETDAGSSSYSKDQRDTICRKAADFLAEFNELAPKVVPIGQALGQTVIHNFAY